MMKAIVVRDELEGRPLEWTDVPRPAPKQDEVLIEVHAAALNRADLIQRAGAYAPPPGTTDVLGLEVAGRIVELGSAVKDHAVGDSVCVLLSGGGYAEYAIASAEMLFRLPDGWTFEEAAAMPEAYITAFVNLFQDGKLVDGESVLIHAGASGVGLAAIQLAKAAGAHVVVTAGTQAKVDFCLTAGADSAINYSDGYVAEAVMKATDGEGVDLVLDLVGARHFVANIAALRRGGRLVFVSPISGRKAELDINDIMSKRLTLTGSRLRNRSVAEKAELGRQLLARFGKEFEAGTIKPVMDSVFPIEDAESAHRRMAANQNIGKLVLRVR